MSQNVASLKDVSVRNKGRQLLLHGMALVLVGLGWGFLVPTTPYPRLALTAHIQLTGNGVLFMALAMALLTLPNRVGNRSRGVMLLAAWLTWFMALSEMANAWWGTNQMLPIAAAQAGATGGEPWQEMIVKLAHIGAGFGLLAAWMLLLVGFVKVPDGIPGGAEAAESACGNDERFPRACRRQSGVPGRCTSEANKVIRRARSFGEQGHSASRVIRRAEVLRS